jgi:uncharacterized protein (DUF427 family)
MAAGYGKQTPGWPVAAGMKLEPGPHHPITIAPNPDRVVVRVGDRVVADTTSALTLREASYPAVQYIPFGDLDQSLIKPTEHATHCPFKGDASYYSLVVDGSEIANAIWTYTEPYDAVAEIAGHVAFYPQNVTFTST